MTQYKRVNIAFDQDLWRKIKAQAALDGETVSVWVSKACEKRLKGDGKVTKNGGGQ